MQLSLFVLFFLNFIIYWMFSLQFFFWIRITICTFKPFSNIIMAKRFFSFKSKAYFHSNLFRFVFIQIICRWNWNFHQESFYFWQKLKRCSNFVLSKFKLIYSFSKPLHVRKGIFYSLPCNYQIKCSLVCAKLRQSKKFVFLENSFCMKNEFF